MNDDETREVIKNLTNSYEDPSHSPAAFHKMDDQYIKKNLKVICGFDIVVEEINNVFKLMLIELCLLSNYWILKP